MSFNVSQYLREAQQAARGQPNGYTQLAPYQSEAGINLSAMERDRQNAARDAAAQQAARNQQWRDDQSVGLWKDNSIRTNDERNQLIAELKRIQNANSIPMTRRRDEIRQRLAELDMQLGNGEMSYGSDRLADTVTGGVKGWAGDQATFFGKGAELLSRIGEKLGSNTSDYAGWATDEMSAAQIGNENDATKRLQELAEAKAMQDTGRRWSETGASEIERAKNGLGQLGRLGVDLGANAVQMGLDAGTAALTGGSGALVPLFTRASGGGMREAEAAGADLKHQLLYGSTVGAVEAATEMLTGGLAKVYGAGGADELVERAVRKMTTSEVGRRALLTLSDMAGEGVEEIISDIVNPYAKALYDGGEALKKKFGSVEGFKEAVSEELYDGLVGALMGGFGSVTKTVSGDTARTVQRMGYADQAEGSLRSQWGTDRAGRRASSDYAQLIARQMMGEDLNQADQARFNARPTAVGVLEGMQNQQYEDFRQTEEGRSYEQKVMRDWIDDAFSGENLSEDQKNILAEGVGTGTASIEEYAAGVHNAYNLGKTKVTLEQARQAANENGQKLNDVQFQHAYQMGYSAAAETADTTTEEGRTTVVSNLRALGSRAAEIYQAGQDVGSYSNAMINAVEYAATGADLKAITQTARQGGSLSWTGHLTEAQVQRAEELGRELQEERKQNTKKRAAELAGIQEEAARIRKEGNPDVVTIGATIRDTQNFIAASQEEVSGIMQGLKIARQAQPGIVDTAEYKERMAQADALRVQIREAKKTQNELRAKRQAARKGQGRQKGRAIYESKAGEAGGLRYKAVNRAGLSGTQKAAARVAEAIAEATGLEIHIVDFGKGFGGEYFPGTGGKLYLNINAAFDGKNFSIMSLSHELTHWLQEYAPEQYAELKQIVLAEMQRNPERYESIFQERKGRQTDLTSAQITDEMVANACQTVLLDTDAIQRIVNEHRTLAERILDFILQLVDDIREAFGEVDLSTDRSIFREMHAVEDAIDQVRDLWLDAFETATENLQAQKTVSASKNTATMVLDNNKAEVSGGGSPENRTLAQPKLSAENSIANAEETVKGERQLQAWDEGTVYNNRALVSEDTLKQWLKDYAASNPNYAQAYIAYMSPLDFLRMTTSGIPSRLMIEKQAEGLTVGRTVEYSKEQPIQLRIDTKTGKVEGHEGRHRMAALRGAGLTEVPVLLFDSSNKYDKQAIESLKLVGQDFNGRTNTDSLSVKDAQPLSRGNLDTVREKFTTKSATQRMQEKYGGRQTVQFQAVGSEDSGTLSIKEQIRAHETDHLRDCIVFNRQPYKTLLEGCRLRSYRKYIPKNQSEFDHRWACWAINHRGWAKAKRMNRRLAKRKFNREVRLCCLSDS